MLSCGVYSQILHFDFSFLQVAYHLCDSFYFSQSTHLASLTVACSNSVVADLVYSENEMSPRQDKEDDKEEEVHNLQGTWRIMRASIWSSKTMIIHETITENFSYWSTTYYEFLVFDGLIYVGLSASRLALNRPQVSLSRRTAIHSSQGIEHHPSKGIWWS